eukprot:m.212701 g.212701  ORF g.212701 m.212701 type:complete len:230 (+) comp25537_c0_seq1:48-737(+)
MALVADEDALEVIQQQTGDMEQKLAIFIESRSQKLRDAKDKHTAVLHDNKENAEKLRGEIVQTESSTKGALALRQEREAAKSAVEKKITELKGHASSVSAKLQSADAVIAALLEKKRMLIETKRAVGRHESDKTSGLAKSIDLHKKWLGLEFSKREGERLQFIFTKISEQNPDRKYYFTLRVGDDNLYEVTDCAPRVAALSEMVDSLQKSNDFGAFVRRMRIEFKQMSL